MKKKQQFYFAKLFLARAGQKTFTEAVSVPPTNIIAII
jgi:hypothetical protein